MESSKTLIEGTKEVVLSAQTGISYRALEGSQLDTSTSYDGDYPYGEKPKKSRIWLKHYATNVGDITSTPDGDWLYPITIKYQTFWKNQHLIDHPEVIQNVSKVCWNAGNRTIQSGQFLEALLYALEYSRPDRDYPTSDMFEENGMFEENNRPPQQGNGLPSWFTQDGNLAITSEGGGYDIQLPTYPIPLKPLWKKREWYGLALFTITTCLATLLLCSSIWMQRRVVHKQTWGAPAYTEEAINDMLQVGWRYQKENSGQQLYLQVYDKSRVGYNDENSMLMGGVEQTTMTANTAPLTNWTDRDAANASGASHPGSVNSSRLPLSSGFSYASPTDRPSDEDTKGSEQSTPEDAKERSVAAAQERRRPSNG